MRTDIDAQLMLLWYSWTIISSAVNGGIIEQAQQKYCSLFQINMEILRNFLMACNKAARFYIGKLYNDCMVFSYI